jgi:electron transfer flavoprotein alpha subunit
MTHFLVFCEVAGGSVKGSVRELLGKARELAGGDQLSAVVIGSDVSVAAAALGALGADRVVTVEDDALSHYVPTSYAAALAQVVGHVSPDVVLGSASVLGKDLFPRAALLCDAAVGADVIDLSVGADGIEGVRSLYSGKCLAKINLSGGTKFFTVRPNSFIIESVVAGAGAVEAFSADLGDAGYEVLEVEEASGARVDLTEATSIISGGRALGSAEKFDIFNEAADLMGAAVGASRAAVDAGFAPHSMQVGQTGKVVNPNLYIACGISGAIQHLAGMRTSKVIVAINKDAEAPIFQHATYGIVGDLFEVVPLLTAELRSVLTD